MLFITQSYNSSHHVSMFMPFIKITYLSSLAMSLLSSTHLHAPYMKRQNIIMIIFRIPFQNLHLLECSLIDISPGMDVALLISVQACSFCLCSTPFISTQRERDNPCFSSKWVVRNYQIQTKRCRQLCPYLSCHHDILNCSVHLEVKVYSCEGECNSSMHLYRLSVKTKVLQNIITNFLVKLRSLSAT